MQNVEGSGLGLPIVAALMRASHGMLEIRANTPPGLHVVLGLPAAPDATEPVPAEGHPPQPASLLEV